MDVAGRVLDRFQEVTDEARQAAGIEAKCGGLPVESRSRALSVTNRREFLRTSAALSGAAVLTPSLQGLIACAANRPAPITRMTRPELAPRGAGGYGLLRQAGPQPPPPPAFTYSLLRLRGKT